MVLYRAVFRAKYGNVGDLVAAIKEMKSGLKEEQSESLQMRILTDISGPFNTVVVETTHESWAAVEKFRMALSAQDAASDEPPPMNEFLESGRNEYYTIEI